MLSRSLREQIKCRWREFRREPSAFFWVIFMPILWMIGLGFAFSKPRPETYGVGWLTPREANVFVETVQERLAKDSQIKIRKGSEDDLTVRMKRGEISLIVQLNAPKQLRYQLDQSNPEAMRAKSYVDTIIQRTAGRQDPLTSELITTSADGGRYIDFLIPGLLGLSVMTSSLFGIGMTIVSNRKENLLKRYLATPMKASEYLVSHMFGRMMVLTAEFLAVLLAGYLIFHFRIYGSFLGYLLFTILGAAAFTSIALLCATRTSSIPMISGLTNIISLPMMMLSGVFFSKNNLPDWLIHVVNFLPLTALNDGLRKIALEGLSILDLGFEASILGGYTLTCLILAQRIFRWY